MKDIAIFEDGKGSRGSRAKLVKRGNKRVLIQFLSYDYDTDSDVVITEWFNLFIPSYVSNKKPHKHNNKRKQALYVHWNTNMFYCDYNQSKEYKTSAKEAFTEDYYNEVFGTE